ncbi:helix-turn-helix transcriptional regulator [Streptomyces sp. XM4193]|uniref:helix-turn-helix domain-containing protein n=1 Tax=Streptomyces sp. XM4193 TaxID=2929782 RepID=UPI001FF86119|nr:helix-turn-helix transcriptional regulator [Streptomyces sp. XM4193]MCK1799119.1 helix-turn-helix transcriptional regulator [Streptomyces sp. XM4193]
MSTSTLAPGANVAALRHARGLSQAALARRAAISVSLLSKAEVGARALTPTTAAAIARALGVTMAEVLGQSPPSRGNEALLHELRSAVRDYDRPRGNRVGADRVAAALTRADTLRNDVDITGLLAVLPELLRDVTDHAFAANTSESWMAVADVYSSVYWISARHRWMDLAELAVTRQQWAVRQKPNPLGEAIAARDRAGAYLNGGDFEGGLHIVDRAIARAESQLHGPQRAFAVGMLNLRGMTLAGRLRDKREGRRAAERHIRSAREVSQVVGEDVRCHSMIFGPGNTATHELATRLDLGRPDEALRVAGSSNFSEVLAKLPPTRISPTHINIARAQLDLGDRDGALDSLTTAWRAAPQMARIHPMGREVFRVVASLHRRGNAKLTALSRMSGMAV